MNATPATTDPGPPARRRRYAPLWIMLGLFALPYAAAWLVYFSDALRESLPLSNYGQLIGEPRETSAPGLRDLQGKPVDLGKLRGQWVLIVDATSGCEETCIMAVYYLRQVRLALGRERYGVERLLLLRDAPAAGLRERLRKDFPGTRVVLDGDAEGSLHRQLTAAGVGADGVILLDKDGRAIMRFPMQLDPKRLLKDLKRLVGGRGRG